MVSKSVLTSFTCASGLLTLAVWLDNSSNAAHEIAEEAAGTMVSAKRTSNKEPTQPAAAQVAKPTTAEGVNASASDSAGGSNGKKIHNH